MTDELETTSPERFMVRCPKCGEEIRKVDFYTDSHECEESDDD